MSIQAVNAAPSLCNKVFLEATRDLRRFRPSSFYANSADEIGQAQGYINFDEFRQAHDFRRETIKFLLNTPKEEAVRTALLQDLFDAHLFTPMNYQIYHQTFIPIEMARRIVFPDIKPAGIQLASNWGVYPLFLKEQMGLTDFYGIDVDKAAIAYAEKIGAPVIEADARSLPFPAERFDLVFSSHFLDCSYFGFINSVKGLSWGEEFINFRLDVMREVYRVLRPGGWFITQTEVVSCQDLISSWTGTIAQVMTFNFESIKFDGLFAVQKG